MRSIKTNGGLKRGRGFTEIQRLVCLLMPASADINFGMQKLTGVISDSSEQHKDCLQSNRVIRDTEDTFKILSTWKLLNRFGPDPSLRGLVSAICAAESVNVDDARSIDEKILDSMVGKSITDIFFQKKKRSFPRNNDSCTTGRRWKSAGPSAPPFSKTQPSCY